HEDERERRTGVQADLGLEVGRHVTDQRVVGDVQRDHQTSHCEQRPPVVREEVTESVRSVRLLRLLSIDLTEDRGVLQLAPQVDTDEAKWAGEQERDAPSPLGHGLLTEDQLKRKNHGCAEDESAQGSKLKEATEKPALLVG